MNKKSQIRLIADVINKDYWALLREIKAECYDWAYVKYLGTSNRATYFIIPNKFKDYYGQETYDKVFGEVK